MLLLVWLSPFVSKGDSHPGGVCRVQSWGAGKELAGQRVIHGPRPRGWLGSPEVGGQDPEWLWGGGGPSLGGHNHALARLLRSLPPHTGEQVGHCPTETTHCPPGQLEGSHSSLPLLQSHGHGWLRQGCGSGHRCPAYAWGRLPGAAKLCNGRLKPNVSRVLPK